MVAPSRDSTNPLDASAHRQGGDFRPPVPAGAPPSEVPRPPCRRAVQLVHGLAAHGLPRVLPALADFPEMRLAQSECRSAGVACHAVRACPRRSRAVSASGARAGARHAARTNGPGAKLAPAGITVMENRFAREGLLIASHLTEVLDEYMNYHRINGVINKIDDDLLSAIRVGLMDLGYAPGLRPRHFPGSGGGFERNKNRCASMAAVGGAVAKNIDFDVFTARTFEE